ncbi:MFS transporter [Erysipelotrichaceae bacterium]|nr:MFS transporter [Erysipelotrichaceae bacterium]
MKKENSKRYFQFMLIILAAGSIYPLIYLKAQYQETILQVYNMSIQQLNWIYTILGFVFILGYFPSGMLCDKFSAKNLLTLSLLGTAIGGFWFAQVPSYNSVIIIFAIWGIFSVFTFWGAHLKVVKMLSTANEDGRFFGILDSGRGLVEAVLASIALAIFTGKLGAGVDVASQKAAIVPVIYMYSIVLLVIAVLIYIFVKEDTNLNIEETTDQEESKFKFSDLGKIFKNKYVLYQGLIIFAGYTLYWTNYYFSGYLQTSVGIAPATVGTIMVAVLWMRPIGGLLGGIAADKIGKSITIAVALVGGSLCLLVLALAPKTLPITFFSALIVITGLVLYIIRGTYWSLLGESKIDNVLMGTAIGVISFIGYLPDILIPYLNTFLWDNLSDAAANKTYFLVSMGIGLVGAFVAILYRKARKSEKV